MPELNFQIEGSEAVPFAVAPTIAFKLQIATGGDSQAIHSMSLQCQIQIEATQRRYSRDEQRRLFDIYGEPHRWGQTLRAMFWTQVNTNVPAFTGTTTLDLLVPCSFDFNIAANKYFASLRDGEIPLSFLFSGTIFYEGPDGRLQVERIPWEKEAKYRLPVSVWQKMMELYYPNERWLSIRGDIFDRISEYKRRRAIATWDQALESLLSSAEQIDDRPLITNKAS